MRQLAFLVLVLHVVTMAIGQPKKQVPNMHYFYNSGWLVETGKHLLVFDFIPDSSSGVSLLKLEQLLKKVISEKKKIIILVSHDHTDHFDSTIFNLSRISNDITYIAGWEYKTMPVGVVIKNIKPGDSLITNDYAVFTHVSSDEGSGMMIKVDGYVIYHAGDHALWADQLTDMFTRELKSIKSKTDHIDLAFLPAARGLFTKCAYDSVIEKGLRLSAEILRPRTIALQHVGCADKLWQYMQAQQALSAIKTNWIVPVKYDQAF